MQGWSGDTKQDLIAAEELTAAVLAHNPLDIYGLSIGGHLIPGRIRVDPRGSIPSVMPTQVGIHDLPYCTGQRRGWRAFARHDDESQR